MFVLISENVVAPVTIASSAPVERKAVVKEPENFTVVKSIGEIAGDWVCPDGPTLRIRDLKGSPWPWELVYTDGDVSHTCGVHNQIRESPHMPEADPWRVGYCSYEGTRARGVKRITLMRSAAGVLNVGINNEGCNFVRKASD